MAAALQAVHRVMSPRYITDYKLKHGQYVVMFWNGPLMLLSLGLYIQLYVEK